MKPLRYLSFRVKRKKPISPSAQAISAFSQLKAQMAPYLKYFEVVSDTEDDFEAITKDFLRVRRGNFGTVTTQITFILLMLCEDRVKLQFHPLHLDESLLISMPPELLSFKTHVNTFQFKTIDPHLLQCIEQLFKLGIESYKKQNFIR